MTIVSKPADIRQSGQRSSSAPNGSPAEVPKLSQTSLERRVARDALVRQARERLSQIEERRDVVALARAKKSQRDIAALLNTTQPRIMRILRTVDALDPTWDDSSAPSAEELILRAFVGETSRDDLVATLSAMEFTPSTYSPEQYDVMKTGTWSQIEQARLGGYLSAEEFNAVASARPRR